MAHSLIIYIDKNTKFNSNELISAFSEMDLANIGISKGKYSEGFGQYRFKDEVVIINIGKNWQFIAAETLGKSRYLYGMTIVFLLSSCI